MHKKTFLYRIYPTKKQETMLSQHLETCRWLYNTLLEDRIVVYDGTGESLSLYGQQARFPVLKESHPALAEVHSQVLQNVAVRIDLAFKAFFRRVKAGEKPGFPRFRGAGRYESMTFPQSPGGCTLKNGKLKVSKVGALRIVLHRPLEGTPKAATIKRSSTGKWYVAFACEWEPTPLPLSPEQVGSDVGLKTFAHLSTDETIPAPKFFRGEEQALAQAQRRHATAEKVKTECGSTTSAPGTDALRFSPKRRKRRKVVARIHERIAFRRQNFTHQESRKLVNRFGVIAVEDLHVNRMVHTHCLAKSIHDAAWSGFATQLSIKAAWAGRKYVAINPAYTSQDCSRCHHRQKMPLGERTYSCPCCGLMRDRDHNASLNILGVGLHTLGVFQEAPAL